MIVDSPGKDANILSGIKWKWREKEMIKLSLNLRTNDYYSLGKKKKTLTLLKILYFQIDCNTNLIPL